MTEELNLNNEVNNDSQAQVTNENVVAPEPQNDEKVPEETNTEAVEKTFTQAEVDDLIVKNKKEAEARAKRKLEQEYQQKIAQQNASSQGDLNTEDQAFRERYERYQVELQLSAKLNEAAEKYKDFNSVVGSVNWQNVDKEAPHLPKILSGFENAGEIIYELAKDIDELEKIQRLSNSQPIKCVEKLQSLSSKIKSNAESEKLKTKVPAQPIDQVTPSLIDNGSVSNIDRLAKDPRCRF